MSVASRLFHILRARLSTGGSSRPAGDRPHGPAGGGASASSSEPRGTASHGAERAPAVDPELAGLYANLEVPYGSDLETVKAAWKRLAKKYHPDLHGSDPERQKVATELVKGLNRAFAELRRRLKTKPPQGGYA